MCEAMGCSAGFASAPVTGKQLREVAIQSSVTLALKIGQAVELARRQKSEPVAAAAVAGQGKVVFIGKAQELTLALRIGQAVELACRQKADPVAAATDAC